MTWVRWAFGVLATWCYVMALVNAVGLDVREAAVYAGLYIGFAYLALDRMEWLRGLA